MGMKTCSDCGKQISRSARACPNCGKRQTSLLTRLFAWFFALTGVSIMLVNINAPDKPAVIADPQRDLALSARGACRAALLKSLNDPDSAKLDPGQEWAIEKLDNGAIRVQPTGRAKNVVGAYIQGTWDCVAHPEGEHMRIVTLSQIRP